MQCGAFVLMSPGPSILISVCISGRSGISFSMTSASSAIVSSGSGALDVYKRQLVKIAATNLFSQKANRISTKKKDSKTIRSGARLAEKQESSREITSEEVMTTKHKTSKKPSQWDGSVSYTHLDVYKRQVLISPLRLPGRFAAFQAATRCV